MTRTSHTAALDTRCHVLDDLDAFGCAMQFRSKYNNQTTQESFKTPKPHRITVEVMALITISFHLRDDYLVIFLRFMAVQRSFVLVCRAERSRAILVFSCFARAS